MDSLLITATWQAVLLGGISNLLGQSIIAARDNTSSTFNISSLFFFLIWTVFSSPPNTLWQIYLEENFPSQKTTISLDSNQQTSKLDKTNTVIKLLLDQSLSAAANTAGYIAAVAAFKGRSPTEIVADVHNQFWPLMVSGWKVWPLVAVLSFTVVPLHRRPLFWSVSGLMWNVYLTLWTVE